MTEEARISTRASADEERVPSKSARVSTMGWLSFFTMFAIGTDTFLVAPLLPLLQRELDVPLSRAGWLVSAYALGYALFALVAGPVSDRHDRRRVILSGLAAFAVFTCACGLAWSFWSMVAARFLPVDQRLAAAVLRGRGGQRCPVGTSLPCVPARAPGGGAC